MSEMKLRFQGCSQSNPLPSERLVSIAFTMLGVMLLFPWNCVLSATDFFLRTFPDQQWPLYSTQVYQTVFMVVQVIMIFSGKHMSPWVVFAVPLLTCCFSSVVVMLVATQLHSQEICFVFTLLATALLSASMAVLQSSLFGAAAKGIGQYGALPALLILGMGIAGILSMGIALLTSFLFTSPVIGFLILFGSISFLALLSLRWYRVFYRVQMISALPSVEVGHSECEYNVSWNAWSSAYAGLPYELAIFCVFAVTFTVFPAVAAQWRGFGAIPRKSYVTFVMGNFQIMDTVGRLAAERIGFLQILGSPTRLWILVVARGVFIPLFFFCANRHGGMFGSQTFQMMIMAIMAGSNGLLASLAMQFAPRHVPATARSTVGMVMTLALVGGIAAGSYLAMLQGSI